MIAAASSIRKRLFHPVPLPTIVVNRHRHRPAQVARLFRLARRGPRPEPAMLPNPPVPRSCPSVPQAGGNLRVRCKEWSWHPAPHLTVVSRHEVPPLNPLCPTGSWPARVSPHIVMLSAANAPPLTPPRRGVEPSPCEALDAGGGVEAAWILSACGRCALASLRAGTLR
jgi:hypothetical protein